MRVNGGSDIAIIVRLTRKQSRGGQFSGDGGCSGRGAAALVAYAAGVGNAAAGPRIALNSLEMILFFGQIDFPLGILMDFQQQLS